MTDLERALAALGRELDYPPTPDLAGAVARRLRDAPAPAVRHRVAPRSRRAVILAFAALLVTSGSVLAAVPGARDAVLELFGLRGATVERREELPAKARPGSLDLGPRTTLAVARRSLAFAPLVPAALGAPDAVHVRRGPAGGELTIVYRPRPGLPEAAATRVGALITQFRGDLEPDYLGKITGEATRVERITVDGRRAIWIEGAPHFFFYRDREGRPVDDRLRLAGNVLLLERGPLLVRIEGAFSRETALRIARSLR